MEVPQPPEALATVEPFAVRAHHLQTLLQFHTLGAESYIQSLLYGSVSPGVDNSDSVGNTYHTDIFGVTMAHRQKRNEVLTSFLSTFWKLDPESPVTIAAKRRDGVCDSCFIGNHCEAGLPGDSFNDDEYLEKFKWAAGMIGLAGSITERTEDTTLRTGQIIKSNVLVTSATTAQQVVGSEPFSIAVRFEGDENCNEAEKAWRAEQRYLQRAAVRRHWHNNEYKVSAIGAEVARIKPLIGAFVLYAATSMFVNFGQAYQAAEDAEQVTHSSSLHQAMYAEYQEDMADGVKNLKEMFGAGFLYSLTPRRWRLKNAMQGIADREEQAKD